jgi:hypothetical protein
MWESPTRPSRCSGKLNINGDPPATRGRRTFLRDSFFGYQQNAHRHESLVCADDKRRVDRTGENGRLRWTKCVPAGRSIGPYTHCALLRCCVTMHPDSFGRIDQNLLCTARAQRHAGAVGPTDSRPRAGDVFDTIRCPSNQRALTRSTLRMQGVVPGDTRHSRSSGSFHHQCTGTPVMLYGVEYSLCLPQRPTCSFVTFYSNASSASQ